MSISCPPVFASGVDYIDAPTPYMMGLHSGVDTSGLAMDGLLECGNYCLPKSSGHWLITAASGYGVGPTNYSESSQFGGSAGGREARKPENEDVFMQEDEDPRASDEEVKDEAGGWTEVKDVSKDEHPADEDKEEPADEDKEEIVPDEAIHEVAVGKGLSGVLKLLKDRGTLKESIEWGGRNMDKKKSKLVRIVDDDEPKEPRSSALVDFKKEIRIERTDEFGRIATFLTDPKSVDTDMDAKVKAMIKLIEEDADSIARRAEMYYKKRPELMKLVEEFYRAYRALAERYDHAELVSELGDDFTQAATKTEVLVSILGDDLTQSCMS
ncbi:hypothetical protein SO802_019687 [Lithocarpus litseifolius]|uniref:NAB domain-containing protein n=1 Tax=Lithocarpus litseifolius TaxID=425828 RepID=A0AAW2CTG7_9ROSI